MSDATLSFRGRLGAREFSASLHITIDPPLEPEWAREFLVRIAIALTDPDELNRLAAELADPHFAIGFEDGKRLRRVK